MKQETLVGKLLLITKKGGNRKTHKILGDGLFYKSDGRWFFNMLNISQLSKKELKTLIARLDK